MCTVHPFQVFFPTGSASISGDEGEGGRTESEEPHGVYCLSRQPSTVQSHHSSRPSFQQCRHGATQVREKYKECYVCRYRYGLLPHMYSGEGRLWFQCLCTYIDRNILATGFVSVYVLCICCEYESKTFGFTYTLYILVHTYCMYVYSTTLHDNRVTSAM